MASVIVTLTAAGMVGFGPPGGPIPIRPRPAVMVMRLDEDFSSVVTQVRGIPR